jgi:hypothetical protein
MLENHNNILLENYYIIRYCSVSNNNVILEDYYIILDIRVLALSSLTLYNIILYYIISTPS